MGVESSGKDIDKRADQHRQDFFGLRPATGT